jgi:hypothetical protein
MLAANKGKLQMALRNSEDKEEAQVTPVDDKIFDDMLSSMGQEKEEPKPAEPPKKAPEPDFKQFLNAAAPATKAPEPTEEVWAIEIFEGETKRIETIKRPLPKEGATKPAVSEPVDQSPTDIPTVQAG